MIRKITLVLLVSFFFAAQAQQDGYQTHFQFNEMSYNPSYAGKVDKKICISALWHQQYVGFKSDAINDIGNKAVISPYNIAPTTQFLNLSTRLYGKLGIGVNIINDKIGPQTFTLPKLSAAYYLKLNASDLSFGVSFGQMQKTLDGTKLQALSQLMGNGPDPRVPTALVKDRQNDLGFGFHYLNPAFNNLDIGVSATHLLPGTFKNNGVAFSSLQTHIYANAGAEFPIGSGDLVLQPYLLFKYGKKMQVDVNAIVVYNSQLYGGLSYRQGDNTNLMLGYMAGDFKVGYAFDFILNGLKPGSRTTHELFVQYCYGIKIKDKPNRYILNPCHLMNQNY